MMAGYFLRRLLLVFPTLLGISLLTFIIIHLAPGEPAAMSPNQALGRSAVTPEVVDRMRRTYGLNLPLLFNTAITDRPARVEKLLACRLPGYRQPGAAVAELVRMGTTILPELMARLKKGISPENSRLGAPPRKEAAAQPGACPSRDALATKALLQIIKPTALPPATRGKASQGAARRSRLVRWWQANEERFSPISIQMLIDDLATSDRSAQAAGSLMALGSAAVPALMAHLDRGGAQWKACSRLLSALTGFVPLNGQAPLPGWRAWWAENRLDYIALSTWQKVAGFFGETRFFKWLGRVLTLDFGLAFDGEPVADKIARALPVTLLITLLALLLSYGIAIPLGVYGATHRGRMGDRLSAAGLFMLHALPLPWVALMLILGLGGPLGYYGLTTVGSESWPLWERFTDLLNHLILPVSTLAMASVASLSRYQRAGMLEVIGQDYIRTARAKGLTEKSVIWKHGLRNALIPMVSLLGLQLPYLFGGSVVVEKIFNIPGMGLLGFNAVWARDYPTMMGITVVIALVTVVGMVLTDLLYALLDPRIKPGETWS